MKYCYTSWVQITLWIQTRGTFVLCSLCFFFRYPRVWGSSRDAAKKFIHFHASGFVLFSPVSLYKSRNPIPQNPSRRIISQHVHLALYRDIISISWKLQRRNGNRWKPRVVEANTCGASPPLARNRIPMTCETSVMCKFLEERNPSVSYILRNCFSISSVSCVTSVGFVKVNLNYHN